MTIREISMLSSMQLCSTGLQNPKFKTKNWNNTML